MLICDFCFYPNVMLFITIFLQWMNKQIIIFIMQINCVCMPVWLKYVLILFFFFHHTCELIKYDINLIKKVLFFDILFIFFMWLPFVA